MSAPLDPATILARGARLDADPFDATALPLYQTATFTQARPDAFGEFDYSRTDNPTRRAVEELLSDLEGAARALTYSSGMAALAAVLRLVRPGERVVLGADLYGGTQRFAHRLLDGAMVEHVDVSVRCKSANGDSVSGDPALGDSLRRDSAECDGAEALRRSLERAPARLVLIETPSNPWLRVADVRELVAVAHANGALLVVDATAMTPWAMRPLLLGADVVVHSATKGLSGHGDVTAGVVAVRDADLGDELFARRNAEGTALAPFDAWLLGRGLKTLGVRLDRAQRTALDLARALASKGRFEAVHHPELANHAGREVHARQANGGGVLVSLVARSAAQAEAIVAETRLFATAVSFGGTSSSISIPYHMSHASMPPGAAPPPPPELVRLSVGLESLEDLLADLDAAVQGFAPRVQGRVSVTSCPPARVTFVE